MTLRCIYIVECIGSLFLFNAEVYSIVLMAPSLFIYLLLGLFHFGVIMNQVAVNTCV